MTTPFALPYNFDTRSHGRLILKALLLADAGMIAAIALLLATLDDGALRLYLPIGLGLFALMQLGAALFLFRAASGAWGTIGKLHVTIEPDRFMGIVTRSHVGTFLTAEFKALDIKPIRMDGAVTVLSLIGDGIKTPPRLVLQASAAAETRALAESLSTELHLPLTDTSS